VGLDGLHYSDTWKSEDTLKNFERTLITAALPYANGDIHLGHLAGAYLPADIYTRFLRLTGEDVLFICGSDEYGVPITKTAEAKGITPKELVDQNYKSIFSSFNNLGISFDNYSQTSRDIHTETAQAFFTDLHSNGKLRQNTTDQFYCTQCDRFLADRYVEGNCPKCSAEGARGDQCEKCGAALNQIELVNPVCAEDGTTPELRATTHWFLPLGDWQPEIEKWLSTKPHWKENVLNYCRGWFDDGLSDRAATRDLHWGVKVPLEDHEGKVMYVWFDAPIGYISSTREWANEQGDPEAWRKWWQDDSTRLLHFIGKDNIVFHAIMFPGMLMNHSENWILPDNVPANEFLNLEGSKLSTSRGYAVWLPEFLENFPADTLRYTLARTLPETRDTNFSWEGLQARNNNELGNNFGNLANRIFSFAHKYFDGKVPQWSDSVLEDIDREALNKVEVHLGQWRTHLANFEIKLAMEEAFSAGQVGNRYFDESAPFKSRKTDMDRCGVSISVSLQILKALCVMMAPVTPFAMEKLWAWLGQESDLHTNSFIHATTPLPSGLELGKQEILFPRIEDEQIEVEQEKLNKLQD
jgi:methionyl-tRNA synthetase